MAGSNKYKAIYSPAGADCALQKNNSGVKISVICYYFIAGGLAAGTPVGWVAGRIEGKCLFQPTLGLTN